MLRGGVFLVRVLTFFSSSTSWLFGNTQTFDSNMFQLMGKHWASGEALPYRDLWDLKGPIIFFVNALGYWLAGSKVGVFAIQLLSLSLSSIIALRMLRGGGIKAASRQFYAFLSLSRL